MNKLDIIFQNIVLNKMVNLKILKIKKLSLNPTTYNYKIFIQTQPLSNLV